MQKLIGIKSTLHAGYSLEQLLILTQRDEGIQKYIYNYTTLGKKETEELLGRATYYFPAFEFYLQEADLPEMLKYLPLVESNLKVNVKSSKGALGLWQFMPATARYYGLEVSEDKDERLDTHKASKAATQMLKELYSIFDDWFLTLAAYNCGPSRVKRAIRKAGSRDFEHIKAYLPKQTRNYTDKFFAMMYIGQHLETLQLVPRLESSYYSSISIKGAHQWQQLAEASKVSVQQLRLLNPKLEI